MTVRLALVQLGPIGDIGARAAAAERAGYHRFWFTQHYGHERSGSPMIAAALAAAATETIRIGTAAVLLAHAAPVQVAADAALLSQQSAGRFDLGVASAVAEPAELAAALPHWSGRSFEGSVEELASLVRSGHELSPWAGPTTESPPLWICGSSARSAKLAASVGAGLAHGPITDLSQEIVGEYRSQFVSAAGSRPQVSLLARGYCAGTCGEAEDAWLELGAYDAGLVADFLGDPSQCRDSVNALGDAYGADEIAVTHVGPSLEAIDHSALLLAKA